MSIVQATSAGVKDMADGSLRITFEFDPRYAKEAYSLFGARGTACAIAALTTEAATHAAQKETIAPVEPKTKPGPLCVVACNFCDDPLFWRWIDRFHSAHADNAEDAKDFILHSCCIDSRKELDSNDAAAKTFHIHIREPFMEWKRLDPKTGEGRRAA